MTASGIRLLLVFFLSVACASIVQAHPGHGVDEANSGLMHYLFSPGHWATCLAFVAAVFIIARRFWHSYSAATETPNGS